MIVGYHRPARPAELKHFGAAAASSGGVELYHIPGITPEAPSVAAAFNGERAVPSAVVYGPGERRAMYETLNEIGSCPDVDFVLLGCPHASVDQIRRAAELLDGKRLSSVDRALDHGAALAEGGRRPVRLHRGDRAGRRGGCWPTPPGDVAGGACTGPGCSPPIRPSRRTTCRRSSASRPGSAPSRSASTRPSPGVGTES